MKKNILYILLALVPQVVFSQFLEPKHLTDIYFTDAKGNRDTLQFGLTPNPSGLYAQYGMIDLHESPYDATLDTRVHYAVENVKRVIVNSKGDCDGPTYALKRTRLIIGLYAKYLPVTMSWDPNFLQEICVPYQYFTREFHYDGINPNRTLEMHNQNEFVIDRKYLDEEVHGQLGLPYFLTTTSEGKEDTVQLFYMTYSKEKDLVANNDLSEEEALLEVSPNPVQDLLNVALSATWLAQTISLRLSVVGIDGRTYIEKNEKGTTNTQYKLDTSDLPSGLYLLKIERADGHFVHRKFVKE